jgi:hypothetical protein
MAIIEYSPQVPFSPPPSGHIPHRSSYRRTSAWLRVFSSTQQVDHMPFVNLVDPKTISTWQDRDADLAPRLMTVDMDIPCHLAPSVTGIAIMEPPKALISPTVGCNYVHRLIKKQQVREYVALGDENRTLHYQDCYTDSTSKINKSTTMIHSTSPIMLGYCIDLT